MEGKNWSISENKFVQNHITANGNKFLIGNGYMGIRGTLEEFDKEYLPAVNLSGIYDRVGDGWREPLNAPNPLYTYIKVDGVCYKLPDIEPKEHEIKLDYRHGIFERRTLWNMKRGKIAVTSRRFTSAAEPHLIGMQYSIQADFHADVELITGIDGDVWDIHGPHYRSIHFQQEKGYCEAQAVTHEKGEAVWVSEAYRTNFSYEWMTEEEELKRLHRICFITEVGKEHTLEKFIAVYTDRDCNAPEIMAEKKAKEGVLKGFEKCLALHKEAWEGYWENGEVEIEGDKEAMEALNYSLYHLFSIAPRHADGVSIPARGLSGQTYKGAVFWDTEMFILPFFCYTVPKVARQLIKYRIDTLSGAKNKAREYGYQGAFYPWESQEGGYDACMDYNVTDVFTGRPMRTYFRDKQYHISSAIVYGMMQYVNITGDKSILEDGGIEVILSCGEFYESLLLCRVDGKRFEIHDAIGPDEYHERVNNNGYTNRMAKYTFESAVSLIEGMDEFSEEVNLRIRSQYDVDSLKERFLEAARKLYLPQPDGDGIVEQFDGYQKLEDVTLEEVRKRLLHEKEYWGGAYGVASHTRIIKQADVVAWMVLFPEDFQVDIKSKNYKYYEPRTEHGSSLSACMYALLACECGMQEEAYPFFMKSAMADLAGGGKEWAGLVYIGGTHPAAAGGAYLSAIMGFAGLKIVDGRPTVSPRLPKSFKRMRFRTQVRGLQYEITISENEADVRQIG